MKTSECPKCDQELILKQDKIANHFDEKHPNVSGAIAIKK